MPPARHFAILTCMDARLDPAKFAGLAEGDAHVIRNAGGRASDDAIRSLVISYKVRDDRDDQFGFRAVAGLDYLLRNAPLDIFFELGPVFNVTPDFDVDLTVGIGVRFWF